MYVCVCMSVCVSVCVCVQDDPESTGGYTIENCKSRLHLFLQQTRQPRDMQIRPVGPDHNKWVWLQCLFYF